MAKKDIKQYSLEELKELKSQGKDQTKPDAPQVEVDEAFWQNMQIVSPAAKKSVSLRIDEDVFEWFKSQGPGHIARMQAVLRKYYEANKPKNV